MDEVLKGLLFIGSIVEANNQSLLKQHNIEFVVNATHRDNPFTEEFCYLQCRMSDEVEEDIYQFFHATRNHINRAKEERKACLVHCMAGISRSASLVISYLILEEELTLLQAWELLLGIRKDICPNEGFWEQLMRLDKEQHGQHSIDLTEFRLLSLAMEFEDFVTIEEIRDIYDSMEDIQELDDYLIDKYL